MTARPTWASALAAVFAASSGILFLVSGDGAAAFLAGLVAGVFAAQASKRRS